MNTAAEQGEKSTPRSGSLADQSTPASPRPPEASATASTGLAENLWSTLKIELIYWPAIIFAIRAEAEAALFRYIDGSATRAADLPGRLGANTARTASALNFIGPFGFAAVVGRPRRFVWPVLAAVGPPTHPAVERRDRTTRRASTPIDPDPRPLTCIRELFL